MYVCANLYVSSMYSHTYVKYSGSIRTNWNPCSPSLLDTSRTQAKSSGYCIKTLQTLSGLDVVWMYTKVRTQRYQHIPIINLLTDCLIAFDIHCFGLTAADIRQLISIVLDNTCFSFHDHTYKQTKAFPMWSSFSELNIFQSCALITVYIDDILLLTSFREEAERIFTTFNNIHVNIRFPIEHLIHTGSSLLPDLQLKITKGERHIDWYRKPGNKDTFVQYNSAFHFGSKIGYARNEFTSIQSKCSRKEKKVTNT